MTYRRTLISVVCLALACGTAACSGSAMEGGFPGISASTDDTSGGSANTGQTPGGTALPANVNEAVLGCITDRCDVTQCAQSEACIEGVRCMATCADANAAQVCLEETTEGDQALLAEILSCAAFANCFGAEPVQASCGDETCADDETCEGCPEDCGPCQEVDPTCGDGACADDESCEGCPEDCGPCQEVDPTCGDGLCEEGEDSEGCPQDCGAPGSCLENNCDIGQCAAFQVCASALDCINACDTAECAEGCLEGASGVVVSMLGDALTCAVEAGCFNDDPPPPADSCLVESCDVEGCDASPECQAALDCMSACESAECAEDCILDTSAALQMLLFELLICGVDSGCLSGDGTVCGDGWCVPPESSDNCPEDCGEPNNDCGDGVCEPNESDSCPADCLEMTSLFMCLVDDCPLEWAACLSDPVCGAALPCLNECVEQGGTGCTYQCMPDTGSDTMLDLGTCGGQNGCGNICGDGECDPGESADSCPEDCEEVEPEPVCGDDQCTGDESEDTCPEDCGPGEPVCGDGLCTGDESDETCPEDCGPGPQPECGDDQCQDSESCAQCPEDCGACGGACCEAHDGGGCEEITCQQAVCGVSPDCCYTDWTESCADLATVICSVCDPDAVCGDDECTANENSTNCPEDCDSTTNDFLSCVANVCGDELDDCFDDPDCSDAFPCLEGCVNNGGEGCTVECMTDPESEALWDLGICAGGNGCGNNCGDGFCGPGETAADCPGDCTDGTGFFGVMITDVWDGQCSQFNAAGTDIDAVELLTCDGDDCTTVAFFETVVAEVGTETCTNDYTDPSTTVGEVDGGQLALQGGWVAGEFGTDGPLSSGMIVRVHEFGQAYGGSDDPYTVSLITNLACAQSDDLQACSQSLGDGLGLADFVVP